MGAWRRGRLVILASGLGLDEEEEEEEEEEQVEQKSLGGELGHGKREAGRTLWRERSR